MLAKSNLTAFYDTPIDRRAISQERLDLANRTRTNPFPWRGQFSPELIEALLTQFVREGELVLDPFAGVGTSLFECTRKNISCAGAEINPAAVALAETVMFVKRSARERAASFKSARAAIDQQLPSDLPLFSPDRAETDVSEVLAHLVSQHRRGTYLSNILTNTLIRVMQPSKRSGYHAVMHAIQQHESVVMTLPVSSSPCYVYNADARNLPVPDNSFDFVVTSPPYINVFNYHQNNRPAMELLNWNLLRVAKSEVGSNRKHRQNRFLTVVQYCMDMHAALWEMKRVVRPNGRIIIIIGRESNVCGVSFENGALLTAVAEAAGYDLAMRQERKFQNRFGAIIYEDIIHLSVADGQPLLDPREIGVEVLRSRLETGKDDARNDMRSAIGAADSVECSPMFHAEVSRT